tara:strand:+ start:871 stop:1371 length:501 start_codon:yes stop_codon:yes gene_type:complete
MRIIAIALYLTYNLPLHAQTSDFTLDLNIKTETIEIIDDFRVKTSNSSNAVLRGLDKMKGKSSDLEVQVNKKVIFGTLEIKLHECRYPENNPTGDGFAYLEIVNLMKNEKEFEGWMIASSPGLMSLDNARYDVWLIRCKFFEVLPDPVIKESLRRPSKRSLVNLGN